MTKGYGFWTSNGFYLKRCYDCGTENYAMNVSSGTCYACGSQTRPLKEGTKVKSKEDGSIWVIDEVDHDPISYVAEKGKESRKFMPSEIEVVT